MRITKKMDRELHTALSLDDVLYEKHRRMQESLHREASRIYRHRKNVRVVGLKDGMRICLQLEDVQITPDGSLITVRLPSEIGTSA